MKQTLLQIQKTIKRLTVKALDRIKDKLQTLEHILRREMLRIGKLEVHIEARGETAQDITDIRSALERLRISVHKLNNLVMALAEKKDDIRPKRLTRKQSMFLALIGIVITFIVYKDQESGKILVMELLKWL